jgi:hypothetical protein
MISPLTSNNSTLYFDKYSASSRKGWQTGARVGLQRWGQTLQGPICHHHGRRPFSSSQIHTRYDRVISFLSRRQNKTGADIVTGTRYHPDGGVEGWNFYRKLTSRTANFVTKFVLGVDSSDFTGSFRLYKK